jgi:hypothetical protein
VQETDRTPRRARRSRRGWATLTFRTGSVFRVPLLLNPGCEPSVQNACIPYCPSSDTRRSANRLDRYGMASTRSCRATATAPPGPSACRRWEHGCRMFNGAHGKGGEAEDPRTSHDKGVL